jgi:hypothetical protein
VAGTVGRYRSASSLAFLKEAAKSVGCTQSMFTGVYKNGGPTCVEPGKQLANLVDRSPADVRCRKKGGPLEVSPLPMTSGNGAGAVRKPAPIITTLVPTHSGGWVTASPMLQSQSIEHLCGDLSLCRSACSVLVSVHCSIAAGST